MKVGDFIKCHDKEDVKQTLSDLGLAGFHAVADVHGWIRITGAPEEEHLVAAHDQHGRMQNNYCETLEEAEDLAAEMGGAYEFVEILKGYPGEWESVSRSW